MVRERRDFTPSRNRLRNLKQNITMSDEEFEKWYQENYPEEMIDGTLQLEELNVRIKQEMDRLAEDYDLDDMKANDMIQLKSFILASIQLADLERKAHALTQTVDSESILTLEKINKIMSGLRADISTLSTDLQLTKRIRSQSKDVSIQQKWDELSRKASEFYRRKMLFIFCPNCRNLLSTVWLLYSADNTNAIKLHCGKCDHIFSTNLSELYETGNKNLEDVTIP